MICNPIIEVDEIVQVGDKIRIDLSRTFVTRPDALSVIKKIEVRPTIDSGFIVIHDKTITAQTYAQKDWYLDWIYQDKLISGLPEDTHEITAKVTLDDNSEHEATRDIDIFLKSEEALFSDDDDLTKHEFDILKWIPEGRSTWNYLHRKAKSRIIASLAERNYTLPNGDPLASPNIFASECKEWSTYLTLFFIFSTVLSSRGDIFSKKAVQYEDLAARAGNRIFNIDIDEDGLADDTIDTSSPMLVRR